MHDAAFAMSYPSAPYPPAPLIAWLGRAWHLVRRHWRPMGLTMLPPLVLVMLQGLCFSLSAAQGWKSPSVWVLVGALAGVGFGLLSAVVSVFCLVALSRYCISLLFLPAPIPLRDCLAYLKRIPGRVALLIVLNLFLMSAFIGIDVALFVTLVMGTGAIAGMLAAFHNPMLQVALTLTLMLWGSGMVLFFWMLLSFQLLMLYLPIVTMGNLDLCAPILPSPHPAFDTGNETTPPAPLPGFWSMLGHTYGVIFGDVLRAASAAAMILLTVLAVGFVLRLPADLLVGLGAFQSMIQRLGEGGELPQAPTYALILSNLWYGAVAVFLMPVSLSAVALFWYDGMARREALDLRFWLAQLQRRQA